VSGLVRTSFDAVTEAPAPPCEACLARRRCSARVRRHGQLRRSAHQRRDEPPEDAHLRRRVRPTRGPPAL